MTTFQYTLQLGDGEMIAVQASLKSYLEYCEANAEKGAPYIAHASYLHDVIRRLYDNVSQTSAYYPSADELRVIEIDVIDSERLSLTRGPEVEELQNSSDMSDDDTRNNLP